MSGGNKRAMVKWHNTSSKEEPLGSNAQLKMYNRRTSNLESEPNIVLI